MQVSYNFTLTTFTSICSTRYDLWKCDVNFGMQPQEILHTLTIINLLSCLISSAYGNLIYTFNILKKVSAYWILNQRIIFAVYNLSLLSTPLISILSNLFAVLTWWKLTLQIGLTLRCIKFHNKRKINLFFPHYAHNDLGRWCVVAERVRSVNIRPYFPGTTHCHTIPLHAPYTSPYKRRLIPLVRAKINLPRT